jgi:hypothetical protein
VFLPPPLLRNLTHHKMLVKTTCHTEIGRATHRYGLDEYLPFYRYGDICLWDIAVIIGITVLFIKASRIPHS